MRSASQSVALTLVTCSNLLILFVAVIGWKPPDKSLEASTLAIQDAEGRPRVRLRLNEHEQPTIELLREDGSIGASLGLLSKGSMLCMFDKKDCRVMLQADEEFGRIALFDKDGKHKVEVTSSNSKEPTIEFIDAEGNATVKVK